MNRIERRYPGCTAEELFALVADVEKYPEFIPWISSCHILKREGAAVWVDMIFGLGPLQYRFTSKGVLDPPRRIDITSHDEPFEHFRQRWEFRTDEGCAVIGYSYAFELRSHLLDLISHAVLDEAIGTTIDAFERRAHQLYGQPKTARTPS